MREGLTIKQIKKNCGLSKQQLDRHFARIALTDAALFSSWQPRSVEIRLSDMTADFIMLFQDFDEDGTVVRFDKEEGDKGTFTILTSADGAE